MVHILVILIFLYLLYYRHFAIYSTTTVAFRLCFFSHVGCTGGSMDGAVEVFLSFLTTRMDSGYDGMNWYPRPVLVFLSLAGFRFLSPVRGTFFFRYDGYAACFYGLDGIKGR